MHMNDENLLIAMKAKRDSKREQRAVLDAEIIGMNELIEFVEDQFERRRKDEEKKNAQV